RAKAGSGGGAWRHSSSPRAVRRYNLSEIYFPIARSIIVPLEDRVRDMQARVRTVSFQGIDVLPVDVQVLGAPGNIAFAMVGLADKAVGESRERVRAAFRALGLALPPQRITVNLSPADLAKEASHYDLPIAVVLLAAMGVIPRESIAGFVVLGELALDGALSRVPGVL